jgi:2-oxoisovalerate dehydrogenase E1 component alpha subunit
VHVRAGCRALPDPSTAELFDHVYVEPTPQLLEQRAEFAEFLASVGGAA